MGVSGEPTAVAVDPDVGGAIVSATEAVTFGDGAAALAAIARLEEAAGPRWVWWDGTTPRTLAAAGVRVTRAWDLDAVHRLRSGGWRAGPARVWAAHRGLDAADVPRPGPPDLFSLADAAGTGDAVRRDGYLDPDWIDDGWRRDPDRLRRWAALALDVYEGQLAAITGQTDRPAALPNAHVESAAEVLCAELERDGLPIDVPTAEEIVFGFIGPRPADVADEQRLAAERDERVLAGLDTLGVSRDGIDLRNPASVRSLLRRAGIEVDDTRAWRLERMRDEHPIVDALLEWRKAERIATTFGYRWLDQHVRGGRLHGSWSACDGAAGRMTATAGLHNLPAEIRPAIMAEPGWRFVRADLGQIEPRILAAVSGDRALAAATADDDLYLPVAGRLGVERDVAKVAVLGAMYGQTTGRGAQALQGLRTAYPTAIAFLDDAARAAEGGNDLVTRGGRRVRMSGRVDPDAPVDERELRSRAAARGRYGRNAMIQGAAAEFFKTWSIIVRARVAPLGGAIVLCLHDELLVHVPEDHADEAAAAVDAALAETAHRWLAQADAPAVRFVADTSVITRWSEAR